ncbi:MAG: glycosyltransferase, partial [Clostridia bacterium]
MKISIVTVVLNDKEGLRKTMEGITKQTCRDFESIIIDGLSTDGTREELVEIENKLAEKNIEHTII